MLRQMGNNLRRAQQAPSRVNSGLRRMPVQTRKARKDRKRKSRKVRR